MSRLFMSRPLKDRPSSSRWWIAAALSWPLATALAQATPGAGAGAGNIAPLPPGSTSIAGPPPVVTPGGTYGTGTGSTTLGANPTTPGYSGLPPLPGSTGNPAAAASGAQGTTAGGTVGTAPGSNVSPSPGSTVSPSQPGVYGALPSGTAGVTPTPSPNAPRAVPSLPTTPGVMNPGAATGLPGNQASPGAGESPP